MAPLRGGAIFLVEFSLLLVRISLFSEPEEIFRVLRANERAQHFEVVGSYKVVCRIAADRPIIDPASSAHVTVMAVMLKVDPGCSVDPKVFVERLFAGALDHTALSLDESLGFRIVVDDVLKKVVIPSIDQFIAEDGPQFFEAASTYSISP